MDILYKRLSSYHYGYFNKKFLPYDGQYLTPKEQFKLYYVKTPKEFVKYKIGDCVEFVNYLADYFDKNYKSEYHLFYYNPTSIFNYLSELPYHTMFICKRRNKWIYMECSFNKKFIQFNSLEETKEYLLKSQRELFKKYFKKDPPKEFFIEYTQQYKKLFGMSMKEINCFFKSFKNELK